MEKLKSNNLHAVGKWEEEHQVNILSYDEFKKRFPDLTQWLVDFFRYPTFLDDMFIFSVKKNDPKSFQVVIFSNLYKYVLYGHTNTKKGYLGGGINNRKYRAGETWFRGNDLSDGEYKKETLLKIMADVVSYELVQKYS